MYLALGLLCSVPRNNLCNPSCLERHSNHLVHFATPCLVQCGWSSFFKQQAHHLGIALESDGNEVCGGYTYGEMVDIFSAANATKSNIIGMWWRPDATANSLDGSGSDLMHVCEVLRLPIVDVSFTDTHRHFGACFAQVILPPATQDCVDNRVDVTKRCDVSATDDDIFGDEAGSCGESLIHTQKAAAGNMRLSIKESGDPIARMSPAYEVYDTFTITELQINQIMGDWKSRGRDDPFDLRFATCKWIVDNFDHVIDNFIPTQYPRAFVEASATSPAAIVALIFSAVSIIATVGTTTGLIYLQNKGSLKKSAQIEFLMLLLLGLFFVSIGSLLLALQPSDGTCTGAIWMINVGYTAQLVPTLIRVSTIITIVRASMKMKVVRVDKKKLLTRSVGLSAIAALYCTFWTVFDPPRPQLSLDATQNKNDFGETIVTVSSFCASNSSVWMFVMYVSQAFLLVCASVLAYQMRSVPNVVNDSTRLAVMIYVLSMFLVLRSLLYVAGALSGDALGISSLQKARSILCSVDAVSSLVIFFPRVFFPTEEDRRYGGRSTVSLGADARVSQLHPQYQHPTARLTSRPSDPGLSRQSSRQSDPAPGLGRQSSRVSDSTPFDIPDTPNDTQHSGKMQRGASNSGSGLHIKQLLGDSSSEIDVEEEKEEESSPNITFKMESDRSLILPKWVVEKYGETVEPLSSDEGSKLLSNHSDSEHISSFHSAREYDDER